MELYIINAPGRAPRFEGTQADAKATAKSFGGTWAPHVVADRKEERIAWLNSFSAATFAAGVGTMLKPRPDCLPTETMGRDMSAGAILARSDNPGIDVDGIVETIINSKAHALRRFAAAVAIAFSKLAGE